MLKFAMIGLLAASAALAQTPSPSPASAKSNSPAGSQAESAKPQASPAPQAQPAPAAKPGEAAKETKKQDTEAALPPATPVITIHGVCDEHKPAVAKSATTKGGAAACTTRISKERFDELVKLVVPPNQPAQPAVRRNLAQRYVELLAIADAAKKAGVEKSPEYQLLRLRALTEAYQRQLDEKYKNAPPAEVQAYYNQHKGDFESVTLRRVYVPKTDPTATKATAQDKVAFAKKTEDIANELRDRAAKGEDMDALQKDAYAKLGLKTTPPNTSIGPVRKGALPAPTDKEIFSLAEGGVYKSDEPTAVVIYKVEKKQALPLDQVKDEIARTLLRQKMEARLKQINDSVKADYNESYFGPPAAPPSQLPPGDKR